MNAGDINADDARRDALRVPTTVFTRWGVDCLADPVGDPAAVRELRV